jgi:hypothetical protein
MSDIKEIANELHKPIRKTKEYRRVVSLFKNNIWSMDLVDMQQLEKDNNNFKYILTCIDLYTRYAWAIPVKNKTGKEIENAI